MPAPHPAPQRHVYAVTTHRGRHLFGVHRADRNQCYTSYVLGFDRAEHAIAVAKGLEAYRRAHGRFPPRDLCVDDMDLSGQDHGSVDDAMRHVAVDAVRLSELVERLDGTGIVLSLLTQVSPDDEEDYTFMWTDVDCSPRCQSAAASRLNALLSLRGDEPPPPVGGGGDEVPALLPKPRWRARPRAAAALGMALAIAAFGGPRAFPIVVAMAALSLACR